MRVLLFEPRVDGHHLPWTGMIAGTLLERGAEVIFAHGDDPRQFERLEDGFPGLTDQLQRHQVQQDGRFDGGSAFASLCRATEAVKPEKILVANLDEFASNLFRRAALGGGVPKVLKGILRGIYHRSRPLDPDQGGFGNAWKYAGYRRLARKGVFAGLGLLDEFLVEQLGGAEANPPVTWMPDFWRPFSSIEPSHARQVMAVPEGRKALLCFGVAHRRKGIDLAVEAMERLDDSDAFLLVAGRQANDPKLRSRLAALESAGRAVVHDRFLTEEEVSCAFLGCDRVLIPYHAHYGSSNVLSTAAAAKRPVIASDFHLIGRRVIEHKLGIVHRDGDAEALAESIEASLGAAQSDLESWETGMAAWARRTSPVAFTRAVLELLDTPQLTWVRRQSC